MSSKRFRIAFSFAGEKRDFVKQVAALLAKRFGLEAILYDKYHEAEFARRDLGIYLPELYHKQSDFVVVVACPDYDVKQWTGLEWTAIHDLLSHRKHEEVMLCRFDHANVTGLYSTAGFVELDDKTPEQFAILILERLALNEGNPRDHYLSDSPPSSSVIPHSSLPVPSNLPGGYIGRIFLGREDFLDQLRASLLKQTHATAITQATAATGISGLGGMGKTHAAVEYAHRHRGDYSALLFACGHSPERLSTSLAQLCDVLHLNDKGDAISDESVRVAAALDWLSTHRDWLLIVDNVDDMEAAKALTAMLERLTSGHVLITSRLHGWADNIESLDLEVLNPEAATDLLLKLTDKDRRKASDDSDQARKLADLMDGLPLALHQAAGYIREQRLTLAGYLAIYQQEASELLGWFNSLAIPYAGPEELGPRPVLITWKTSFDKLDEDTRFWLLVFAHFAPDPIPEFLIESAPDASDEVKTIHRTALKAIAQAETYSLLTRYDAPPRFKLHRLVQHIIRLTALEHDSALALTMGIQLIQDSNPGNATDVRTWPRWNPLQAHAIAIASHDHYVPGQGRLGWLLSELGNFFHTKGLHAEAEKYSRRALKLDEARYGPDHPHVAPHLNNLAAMLQATNQMAEAEPLMRRALIIDEASYGPDHSSVAIDLNNLAQLLQETNRLAEAEPLMRCSLRIDEANYGPDHPTVAIRLNNLAQLLQETNRLAEAEPLMRRALVIGERSFGQDHPSVALRLNNLAQLLQDTNRLTEAEPLMRRALGISEASFGKEHPSVATNLHNLARLLMATNRLTEAEPLMRRALVIDEASYGPGHPSVALRISNLASLLNVTNRFAEAEPLMRRALDIDEASYGLDHPQVAIDLNNLAQLLKATNRLAEAKPLMRRALEIDEASYGPDHPRVAIDLNNLALLLKAMNRLAEAEPLMRRALEIDEASYGPDHPDVARDLNNLAALLKDTNRLAAAEPLIRRAFGIFVSSLGLEHPDSQGVGGNYIVLLQALKLPEAEIQQRLLAAVGGSGGPGTE